MTAITPATTTKHCPRCGEDKALGGFHSNRAERDGLTTYCKPCGIAVVIDYRRRNLEKVRARRAEYRQRNREKLCKQERQRRFEDPQHVRTLDRANRERNREKHLAQKRAYAARNREILRLKAFYYRRFNLEAARARDRENHRGAKVAELQTSILCMHRHLQTH